MLIDFRSSQDFILFEVFTNGGGASSEGTSDTAPGTHHAKLSTLIAGLTEVIDILG